MQLIAHRTNCSNYYSYDGIIDPLEQECPYLDPYFDSVACHTDLNKCCDPCLYYCRTQGTKVADPLDCTRFYYCSRDEYFPDISYRCPSGQYFNEALGDCADTSTCSQLCDVDGCGGGGGITTPTPTTSNPSTDQGGCYSTFACKSFGYFPACLNFCSPRYFHCSLNNLNGPVELLHCPDDHLLDPNINACVSPQDCPYPYHP
ncbi:hypothetical protein Pcinc_018443 [Petrolisthes cinctipes]|uniref:Chitin-binding type-2 domain-containing protein n=1 Tax=Petrolisthes cinctipes TaxID=88211 RepID=A0AAE1FNP7_PETCI|nr:hypothetical protein Pcinc_018443 [Petrolisthes cinctipes]